MNHEQQNENIDLLEKAVSLNIAPLSVLKRWSVQKVKDAVDEKEFPWGESETLTEKEVKEIEPIIKKDNKNETCKITRMGDVIEINRSELNAHLAVDWLEVD